MAKLMCFLVFLLGFALESNAQTPPNLGFDNGDFSNWQCYTGSINTSGSISLTTNAGPTSGRQEIIGVDGDLALDPYGLFPLHCPNGSNFSAQLGNNLTGAQAEALTYTLTVPQADYSVFLNYAVVLENPSHTPIQQPKFTALAYDVTDGYYISCPQFNFIAGPNLPGFKLSKQSSSGDEIFYKDWSTVVINLNTYKGKVVRLEFTTNDCTLGGHFGYAYLDLQDSYNYQAISGNAYCGTQNVVNLIGPPGFSDYTWLSGDLKTVLGTKQNLTLSPAPPNGTQVALAVVPYASNICVDTFRTTINKILAPFVFKTVDTLSACAGSTVDLTAPAVTAGSDADLQYTYYADAFGDTYAYTPNMIRDSGTYFIKAVNPDGCSGILPVHVKFELPPTTVINNPTPANYPGAVDITEAAVKIPNIISYTYFTDAKATMPLDSPMTVRKSGTYYVKLVSKLGCQNILPIQVTIGPPIPFSLIAPNTFTPNGDGVNDLFQFNIKGYLDFGSVKIFNRNGQMLFTSKTIGQPWDGNFNGKQVPDGVYYWVFEGTDTYFKTTVTKSGSVTIIR